MQSIFRLPWCSDPMGPKASESAVVEKMRATPVVEIPALNKLKRKRAISSDGTSPLQTSEIKKPRPEKPASPLQPAANERPPAKSATEQTFTQTSHNDSAAALLATTVNPEVTQPARTFAQSISSLNDGHDSTHGEQPFKTMDRTEAEAMADVQHSTSDDVMGLTPLQQVIENEFNMQILMKHNELRLIEQELAKCQVALEQLRRCELRPFPGDNRPTESVSTGIGPSIAPPPGYTRPSHPAPHGVTDGPYSRHYRHWLLQDPQFDSIPMYAPMHHEAAGRPTRNSGSARKSLSKSFVFPGGPSDNLQSLPNYPAPAPKDKSAPLVLRRSTDGQLVKLICNNCQRGNFSSIQGFLNHCRIAHKVDYKSHDAAAIDCGQLLDENEAANLPPGTHTTPAPKQHGSRISTAASTPMRNLVHPFNTPVGASIALDKHQRGTSTARVPIQPLRSADTPVAASPFTPSPQVPRLSAHFAKYQLGGDLAKAAASAKQKVDLGTEDDMISLDSSEQESLLEPTVGARTVADAGRIGMKAANGLNVRLGGRTGFKPTLQRPRPSPLTPDLANSGVKLEHSEIPESPQDAGLNLSPHTADSNPGLVSDHEDDDHGSASEEEAPQEDIRRPITVPGTCGDNMEIDVDIEDDMDESGVIIRRNNMFAGNEHKLGGIGSPSRRLGVNKRSS